MAIFIPFCIKSDRSEFSLKIELSHSLLPIKSYIHAKNQKKTNDPFPKKPEKADRHS